MVKKSFAMSLPRVLAKRGADAEKPGMYQLRYIENFFGISNAVSSKLSKHKTHSHFFTTLLRLYSKSTKVHQ
jgi:hypothetical protein